MDFGDFDTSGRGQGGGPDSSTSRPGADGAGTPDGANSAAAWWIWLWGGDPVNEERRRREAGEQGDYLIPGGSRKAVLVHLAAAIWRAGHYDARACLPEVRGHDLTPGEDGAEDKLVRALTRTSMGEIEHVVGPHLQGKKVIVQGHLAGVARTAVERLGAEVTELALEDRKRYVDMTPLIFAVAAISMAVRYVALGLDNQGLYILAGITFALMFGLRPFFFKMQRPRES